MDIRTHLESLETAIQAALERPGQPRPRATYEDLSAAIRGLGDALETLELRIEHLEAQLDRS